MLNTVSSLLQTPSLPAAPAPAVAAPARPATASSDKSALGADTFQRYSSLAGLAAGGGFAAYKLGGQAAASFKEIAEALKPDSSNLAAASPALQKLVGSTMRGAGLSALVATGISAISNGISVARGQNDAKSAIDNVVSDGISGAIGGFGAVSLAGAGSLILGSFGLVGLPLTIGTVALGATGGVLAGRMGLKLQAAQRAVETEMAAQTAKNAAPH